MKPTRKITPWFESEEFLTKLIKLGMGEIAKHGSPNNAGLIAYVMDGEHLKDAAKIAKLVTKHNERR